MLIININQILIKFFSLRKITMYFDISFTSLLQAIAATSKVLIFLILSWKIRVCRRVEMTTLTEEMRSRGDAKLHELDEGRGPFLPSHLHFTFRIFYHLHSLRTIGGRADLSRAVVSSTNEKGVGSRFFGSAFLFQRLARISQSRHSILIWAGVKLILLSKSPPNLEVDQGR